jgi:hypothetical protein
LDLAILLQSDLKTIDVLFYRMLVKGASNWLSYVNNFKFVRNYGRISSKHGGSCICGSKCLQTEEVNCFQAISLKSAIKKKKN